MSDPLSAKPSQSSVNFRRAYENLKRSMATPIQEPRDLSGIIKDFEMTYELSWKVLKKVLREAGHETLGARDVFTKAYQLGYLKDEGPWLKMIADRNQTSHVYDEADAQEIMHHVRSEYLRVFEELLAKVGA